MNYVKRFFEEYNENMETKVNDFLRKTKDKVVSASFVYGGNSNTSLHCFIILEK